MTIDDIIRMAHEAGFESNPLSPVVARHSNGSWVGVLGELCQFAALVAAAEREACAKVCEQTYFGNPGETNHEIAAAIRARGAV